MENVPYEKMTDILDAVWSRQICFGAHIYISTGCNLSYTYILFLWFIYLHAYDVSYNLCLLCSSHF